MIEIKKITSLDSEIIKPIFNKVSKNKKQQYISEEIYNNFCLTYLSDLKSFYAFGAFDNSKIVGLISFYQSHDEPSWFGTHIRSSGSTHVVKSLLDFTIKFNEECGRLKFYTLWSSNNIRSLRRFAFSEWANERYDYFDEYFIPANNKCLYNSHWNILFNRRLNHKDTIVRCSFLKQKYRKNIPIGGNI